MNIKPHWICGRTNKTTKTIASKILKIDQQNQSKLKKRNKNLFEKGMAPMYYMMQYVQHPNVQQTCNENFTRRKQRGQGFEIPKKLRDKSKTVQIYR